MIRAALVLLSLLPLSAAPPASPDEIIRLGNLRIEQGAYDESLSFFQQAEERGNDPGLIAFNKATAYYHLHDFRNAENHYRMALDDAAIPRERRTKALYNLGNCLIREASEHDIRTLRDAIRCYELCLDMEPAPDLSKDAAHNLELAKLLWNKARAASPNPPGPNTDDPPDRPKPPEPKENDKTGGNNDSFDESKDHQSKKLDFDPKAKLDPNGKKGEMKEEPKKADALPANVPNRLPVIPDTDQLERQSPEDTRRYLHEAEIRLQKQRIRLREDAARLEKRSGKDW